MKGHIIVDDTKSNDSFKADRVGGGKKYIENIKNKYDPS